MAETPQPFAPEQRTILGMLETDPAVPPRPSERFTGSEPLPIGTDFDWEPRPLARAIRTGRRFRWPLVFTWLVLGAVLAAAVHFGLRFPESHADARSLAFTLSATEAAAALGGTETAVDLITDPGAQPEDFAGAIEPLLRLETTSARLADATTAWMVVLPDPIPSHRIADITAGRNRLRSIAAGVDELAGALRQLTDYRTGTASILRLPDLPNLHTPFPAAEAERALTETMTAAVTTLGRLPDIAALQEHRDLVGGLVTWLGDWQGRYLGELRDGNLERAMLLEREARGRIADVNLALTTPLAVIAQQTRETDAGLRSQLDAALILVRA